LPSQSAGGARVPGQHLARAGAAGRRAARGCSEAEAAQRVHKWSPRESPAPARLLAPPARSTPTADAASTACRGLSSSPQAAPEFPTIQPPGARRRASSSTTRLRWASRERPPPGFHQTVEGVTPPPRPAAPRPALHLPTWRRLAPRCRVCVPFCLFWPAERLWRARRVHGARPMGSRRPALASGRSGRSGRSRARPTASARSTASRLPLPRLRPRLWWLAPKAPFRPPGELAAGGETSRPVARRVENEPPALSPRLGRSLASRSPHAPAAPPTSPTAGVARRSMRARPLIETAARMGRE